LSPDLHHDRCEKYQRACPTDTVRHFFASFFAFSANTFSCFISTRSRR
jgi:hypothetical protein